MKHSILFTVYGMNGKLSYVRGYKLSPKPEHKGLALVVHLAAGDAWRGKWVVAEETTSFAIGRGATRAAAEAKAVQVLTARTTDQIEAGLRFATQTVARFKAEHRADLLVEVGNSVTA